MSAVSTTIVKNPQLEPGEDFYGLRREGVGFIAKLGAKLWTDYNVHDPGITILEALCFAITDVTYRAGWSMEDLLAGATPPADATNPYPDQAFPTARTILTVNPVTTDDLRKLLIDRPGIRNAWLTCKQCACDTTYFAWCDDDQLQLAFAEPDAALAPVEVRPLGLYDVALELEADPEVGDLNDRKIEWTVTAVDGSKTYSVVLELRFPDLKLVNDKHWERFVAAASNAAFAGEGGQSYTVTLRALGATKIYDVLGDATLDADGRDEYLRDHWRGVFYADIRVELQPSLDRIDFDHVSVRVFANSAADFAAWLAAKGGASGLSTLFAADGGANCILPYRRKARATLAAIADAKQTYRASRNLDEDVCRIGIVGIEEVAVCADVEVKPDADIEWVQAKIWFEIEQYFNPPLRFYTAKELLVEGLSTEEIFNGPALDSGFIKPGDLTASSLKSVLNVSDIVNKLMDIDGVLAVNRVLLSKYDDEGNVVKGAADPDLSTGTPIFDANKSSASWQLYMSAQHQPRLYQRVSRFLFYKNGLPFKARLDEARDTLTELRGAAERPKITEEEGDLPIPLGSYRNPAEYFPVQYSFPLTYGIGPSGLPSHASALRRAQAKQLKAYLMVFEQMLADAAAQLAHTGDLFSLDPTVTRTYFVKGFDANSIDGFADIENGLTQSAVEAIAESQTEFHERRNRFLDHLLARFGEQFNEYTLLLNDVAGRQVAQEKLIDDKISLLSAYPEVSHDRGKAFDYTRPPDAPDNQSGLKRRFSLLLGFPILRLTFAPPTNLGANTFKFDFTLLDRSGASWMTGSTTQTAPSPAEARILAYRLILESMSEPENYTVAPTSGKFELQLVDKSSAPLGKGPDLFSTESDALERQDEIEAWSANERALVVEHLLLRPKFPGDALYPACVDGGCKTCGDEDPYSFRLTIVMPGFAARYADNLDLRRFAESTIRQETPAHLLGKICWVDNEGAVENVCDPVIGQVCDLLIDKGVTGGGTSPTEEGACACANSIYTLFATVFEAWFEDKILDYLPADVLKTQLAAEFTAQIEAADVSCTTVFSDELWTEVQSLMVERFATIAQTGWQFERFETAFLRWRKLDASFDWTEERLHERVQAIIETKLLDNTGDADLCDCASAILATYGSAYHEWMQGNLNDGLKLDAFSAFVPPTIGLCAGATFASGTANAIAALLNERYEQYREVSYSLHILVTLLAGLRSVYPAATLHDCDDGSDHNPVRLDNTALGTHRLRSSL